jgi:transcriptional regulator of acetoin/glycerol metabolism
MVRLWLRSCFRWKGRTLFPASLGGICVASAIQTPSKRVVAAISVSTPVARMTVDREKEIMASVAQTARQIVIKLSESGAPGKDALKA